MKTIPLSKAIELLDSCTALYIDDESVAFPYMPNGDDDYESDTFMTFETQYGEEIFSRVDNAEVKIGPDGHLILLNSDGHKAKLGLLHFVPVKA